MLSLILPYWDRQEAADKAFKTLEKYNHLDMEVIVVDDGNKVPYKTPETSLNVRVVRFPEKDKPTPQSKAWNAGVDAARGEIIILSCIEVLHKSPVIEQMLDRLKNENDYVLASTYCPDLDEWQVRSDAEPEFCPKGTSPAFLGMMRKQFYPRFDEDYHDGAGYEDKDFIRRMVDRRANFIICDDLSVIHPKDEATISWPVEGFIRNRALFISKWMKPVNFVCLKAGKAYSAEYVNILFDMVKRNLSEGFPGTFYCITDDPEGLAEGIKVIPLPDDLETWWGKLFMFKRGLFEDGAKCVFLDLDTLIIGNIDWLAQYDWKLATLRDFYQPNRFGPAVIAWEAGNSVIWDKWIEAGKPRHPMGDLWWINKLNEEGLAVEALQDKYPSKFCSYKADCKPYPPKGTSIVCFHGQPKPSNCAAEWVGNIWKIGGGGMAELDVIANTNRDIIAANVISACKRDIPWLEIKEPHDGHAVIVAGGPSILNTLDEVRMRIEAGQSVIACNGAAKLLNKHGITPDAQIIIDARPHNIDLLGEANEYYLASQCDPSLFDAVDDVTLFHLNTTDIDKYIRYDRTAHLISSGTTVGLAAIVVAYTQGYRNIHLYGFDSSYEDSHHAYEQKRNDEDSIVHATVGDRTFKCAPWMVQQVNEFQILARELASVGVTLTVAGDGLLPYVARCMSSTGD